MTNRYNKRFALLMALLLLLTSAPLNMLADSFYSPGVRLANQIVDFGIQTSANVAITKKELLQGTTLDIQAAFTGSGGPSFTSGEAGITWDITWQLGTVGPVLLSQNALEPWKATLTPSATSMGETTVTVTCVRKSGGVATDTFRASAVIQVVPRQVKVVYYSNYPPEAQKANVPNGPTQMGTVGSAVNHTAVETLPYNSHGMDIGFSTDYFKLLNYNLKGYRYVTYLADGTKKREGTNDKNTKLRLNADEVEVALTAEWSSENGVYANSKVKNNENVSYLPFSVRYYYKTASRELAVPAVYYYANPNANPQDQPTSVAFQTRSLTNALYGGGSAYNEIKNKVKGYRIHYANGGTLDVPVGSYVSHDMNVMPMKDSGIFILANSSAYGGTFSGSPHCYVEVEVLPDDTLASNTATAHFFIKNPAGSGYFAVGAGIIVAPAGSNVIIGGTTTTDLDNYQGKDYIIQPPSPLLIAESINIPLTEAQRVQWYYMTNRNYDGWHVDGVLLKDINHTVKFVDTGNNVVVRTSSIADSEALPKEHVPTKGDLKKVPGKEFMYWAIDGERIDNGTDGVIGDITSSRLKMVTSNTEVVAVYNPTVRYAYAPNQPNGFPAAAARPALPGEAVVKNGTADMPNGSIFLPPLPVVEDYAGVWVLPDGTEAQPGALYVLPSPLPAGGVVLYAQYRATRAAYTVQHYYEKLDGSYVHVSTLDDDTRKADIGTVVRITDDDKTNQLYTQNNRYVVFDLHDDHVYEITIGDDATRNILKVYYKKVTKTITVDKRWEGTNGLPGAPASFELKQNTTTYPFILSDNTGTNQTIHTISVPVYGDNYPWTAFNYDVQETSVPLGYTNKKEKTGDTYTFTNTYDGLRKDVVVNLEWKLMTPTGPADPWVTPDSISMALMRNGTKVADLGVGDFTMTPADVLVPAHGHDPIKWRRTFANLPMYAPDGTAYEYSVQETVPGGYKADLQYASGIGSADGISLTISNQYTGGLTGAPSRLTATKQFDGGPEIPLETAKKVLALRRSTVEHKNIVKIAPNNVLLKDKVTSLGNNKFEYTWGDTLWTHDAYGHSYIYQVVEIDPNGSQGTDATVVNGNVAIINGHTYNVNVAGTEVTNKYLAPKIEVPGSQVWSLNDAEDSGWVPLAYASLYRKIAGQTSYSLVTGSAQPIGGVYIQQGGSFSKALSWPDMDERDTNGNKYEYVAFVTDQDGNRTCVPGYAKTESGTTVTNTYDGKTGADGKDKSRTISVDKAWIGALNGFDYLAKVTLYRAIPSSEGGGAPYAPAGQNTTIPVSANGPTALDGVAEASWTNLPRYCVNGTEYNYSLEETPVTIGYEHTISEPIANGNNLRFNITNTYSPKLITVKATKEWKAVTGLTIAGTTMPSLKLPLQRRVGTDPWETVKDAGGNPLTFDFGSRPVPGTNSLFVPNSWENLPYSCACGRVYEYRIYEETAPNGYVQSGSGLNLTNTYNGMSPGDAITLTVQKHWVGLLRGEIRPAVSMNLFRNDDLTTPITSVSSPTASEEGNDTVYLFDSSMCDNNLLRYQPNGTPYVYTARETDASGAALNGYTVEGSGDVVAENAPLLLINTRDAGTLTYTVQKNWTDKNGITPLPNGTKVPATKLIVREMNINGTPGAELTAYAKNIDAQMLDGSTLRYEFNLPKYASDGSELAYFIREIVPAGYTAVPDVLVAVDDQTGVLINQYTPGTVDGGVTVNKKWANLPEGTNKDELPTISLQLYQDNQPLGNEFVQEISLVGDIVNGEISGSYTFDPTPALPKYNKDGTEIVYTADETAAHNGYAKTFSEDRRTVINTYDGKTGADGVNHSLTVTATKQWKDENGQPITSGLPANTTIVLQRKIASESVYADVAEQQVAATQDAATNWKATFDNLEKWDALGNEYQYTVAEKQVPNGYAATPEVVGDLASGFTITNTYDGITSNDGVTPGGRISISLTNITRLMVNTGTYPNLKYELTRRPTPISSGTTGGWNSVGAEFKYNQTDLVFNGGNNDGYFAGSNLWSDQLRFAKDGTEFEYSVNTYGEDGTSILSNGVDNLTSLTGHACQYNMDALTPLGKGGWYKAGTRVIVRHIPVQGVLRLSNRYELNGVKVNGEAFEFAISGTSMSGGSLAVLKEDGSVISEVNGFYKIKSGEIAYVTGIAHGTFLTIREKNHADYTMSYTATGVDGASLNGTRLDPDGTVFVNFSAENFHTNLDRQANVSITNKQGTLQLRKSYLTSDYYAMGFMKTATVTIRPVADAAGTELPGSVAKTVTLQDGNVISEKLPFGWYKVEEDVAELGDYRHVLLNKAMHEAPVSTELLNETPSVVIKIDSPDQMVQPVQVFNIYQTAYADAKTATKTWVLAQDTTLPDTVVRPKMKMKLQFRKQGSAGQWTDFEVTPGTVDYVDVPLSTGGVAWNNVPLEDGAGNDYEFRVVEVMQDDSETLPNGFTVTYNQDQNNLGVTNTYDGKTNSAGEVESVTIRLTKTWTHLPKGHQYNPPDLDLDIYRSYGSVPREKVSGRTLTPVYRDSATYDVDDGTSPDGVPYVKQTAETIEVGGLEKYAPDGSTYVYSLVEKVEKAAYTVTGLDEPTVTSDNNVDTWAFNVTNEFNQGSYHSVNGNINAIKQWVGIPEGTTATGLLPSAVIRLKNTPDDGPITIDAFTSATGRSYFEEHGPVRVATAVQDGTSTVPEQEEPRNVFTMFIKISRLAGYRPDGVKYEYTLAEDAMHNYEVDTTSSATTQGGVRNNFTLVTNDYETFDKLSVDEKTTVNVTKQWADLPDGIANEAVAKATLTLWRKGAGQADSLYQEVPGSDIATGANGIDLYYNNGIDQNTSWTTRKYAPNGTAYVFEVRETPVDGYVQRVTGDQASGFTITNTYDGRTNNTDPGQPKNNPVTLTVKKNWTGLETDNAVPTVTIKVYDDEGTQLGSFSFGGSTIHEELQMLSNLKRYKPNGTPYTFYGVEEAVPNGYALKNGDNVVGNNFHFAASADGVITITNHFKDEKRSFVVRKDWYEGDGTTNSAMAANTSVPNVSVQLMQSVTVGGDTTTIAYGLPKLIISNTAGSIPPAADSAPRTAQWTNLPVYDTQGNLYTYSAVEVGDMTDQGYLVAQYPDPNGTGEDTDHPFIINGIYDTTDAKKYTLSGTKTWTGLPDGEKGAPCSFKLLRKESNSATIVEITGAVQSVSDSGTHSADLVFTQEKVPMYSTSGQKYLYKLEESVTNGYESAVVRTVNDSEKTIVFQATNKYTGITLLEGAVSVRATKMWAGVSPNIDPDWVAPVTLRLFRAEKDVNGDPGTFIEQASRTLVFNSALEESVAWTGLARYAPSGKEYAYEVREIDADVPKGYVRTVDTNDPNLITNTYKSDVEKVSFTATKKWEGLPADAATGAPVRFQLKQSLVDASDNTKILGTRDYGITVVIMDNQAGQPRPHQDQNTWNDLPKYAPNGTAYVYTVVETSVPNGYEKTSDDGQTITNTYNETLHTVDCTLTTKWVNITEPGAPVQLQLMRTAAGNTVAVGLPVDIADTESSHEKDNTWLTLPKYAPDGSTYIYSADLVKVPDGYTAEKSPDGLTITLTYDGKTNNTEIPAIKQSLQLLASKRWKNLPVGENGIDVTLRLMKVEGQTVAIYDTATDKVMKDDGSHYATAIWDDLPKYAPSSAVYQYVVREVTIPKGYAFSQTGNSITNTFDGFSESADGKPVEPANPLDDPTAPANTGTKTTVDATTTWVVNGQTVEPGSRALPTVYLQLKRIHAVDGVVKTVDNEGAPKRMADGARNAQWTDLPRYAPDGTNYVYIAHEVSIPKGYSMTQSGNDIVNTYDSTSDGGTPVNLPTPGAALTDPIDPGNADTEASVHATVKWELVPDGATVPTVEVKLWRNGVEHGTVQKLASGTTTAVWTGLQKYAPDGTEYQYTVSEVSVPKGYRMVQDGLTITNIYNGICEGGSPGNLPTPENPLNNPVDSSTMNPVTIEATKKWVTSDGVTVPTIELKLWQNLVEHSIPKTLVNGQTSATWMGLKRYAPDATEYKYTVSEARIPQGYRMVQDGLTITNTYDGISEGGEPLPPTSTNANSTDPGRKMDVTVTATNEWKNVPAGAKTPDIAVRLYRNGKMVEDKAIPSGGAKAEWTGLAKYSPEGKAYIYTVSQVSIPKGYAYTQQGYKLTNTYDGLSAGGAPLPPVNPVGPDTPNTAERPFALEDPANNPTDPGKKEQPVTITATNTWENVPAGMEVPDIAIRLYRNGVQVEDMPMPSGITSAVWTDLPEYSPEGEPYIYAVGQVSIPKGYTMVQDGFEIMNTYDGVSAGGVPDHLPTPENPASNPTDPGKKEELVTITVTSIWENVPAGVKVPDIAVRLYRDGEKVEDKTIASGSAKAEWTGLTKYSPDGRAYIYTVSEVSIPQGYSMVQKGYEITNTYDGVSAGGEPTPPVNPIGPDTPNTPEHPFDPEDPANNPTDPGKKQGLITVTATKVWKNVPAGEKVPDVVVRLYRDGVKVEDKTIASGSTKAEWTGLAEYSADGRAYIYTVGEVSIPQGYSMVQKGYEMTNTYDGVSAGGEPTPPVNPIGPDTPNTPEHPFDPEDPANNPTDPGKKEETVSITATKVWKNVENLAKVPDIEFQLRQNGRAYLEPIKLKAGAREAKWQGLPKYATDGTECKYTVSEVAVPAGFIMKQVDYVITNTGVILNNLPVEVGGVSSAGDCFE